VLRIVEEVTFQTIFQFLQTIGILVGVSYYIISLRNQEKARQVQTFHLITQGVSNTNIEMINEVLQYEWEDYHDFMTKYGGYANVEKLNTRVKCWNYFDSVGYLFKKGLISRDIVFMFNQAAGAHWMWKKFEPIIEEIRIRYNLPNLGVNWEYLVDEYYGMMRQRGLTTEIPEKFSEYIPEQSSDP
jgi:hypothetical protein